MAVEYNCFLTNENISVMTPHHSKMMNSGIKLMIEEEDIAKAMEIIGPECPEIPHCPNCGSTNLKAKLGKKKFLKILHIALSLFTGTVVAKNTWITYCEDCGYNTEFQNPN